MRITYSQTLNPKLVEEAGENYIFLRLELLPFVKEGSDQYQFNVYARLF